MDLDRVHARALGTRRAGRDGVPDLGELLDRGLGDEVLHVVVELGVGLVGDLLGLRHLGREGRLVARGLRLLALHGGHARGHDEPAHARDVVLRVKELQGELGTVGVDGLGEAREALDLGVVRELGRGARGVHGGDVADDDVGDPAPCEPLVEGEAARPDRAVALLVARRERREHDAVLEGDAADLDRLEKPVLCHGRPLLRVRGLGPDFTHGRACGAPRGRDFGDARRAPRARQGASSAPSPPRRARGPRGRRRARCRGASPARWARAARSARSPRSTRRSSSASIPGPRSSAARATSGASSPLTRRAPSMRSSAAAWAALRNSSEKDSAESLGSRATASRGVSTVSRARTVPAGGRGSRGQASESLRYCSTVSMLEAPVPSPR